MFDLWFVPVCAGKMIAPYLDQLSKRAQNVKVIQVDIDQVKSSQPYSKTCRISPAQTFHIRLSVESKKFNPSTPVFAMVPALPECSSRSNSEAKAS